MFQRCAGTEYKVIISPCISLKPPRQKKALLRTGQTGNGSNKNPEQGKGPLVLPYGDFLLLTSAAECRTRS